MANSQPCRSKPAHGLDHIVQKDTDCRIPNTTPEKVVQALMQGGAKPRPETRR